jgi:hypothetical protein
VATAAFASQNPVHLHQGPKRRQLASVIDGGNEAWKVT